MSSAPIGRGERMVLTGYDDVLHIRLEPFVVDGMRPEKYVEQRVTWEALEHAIVDLFPQLVGAMRDALNRVARLAVPGEEPKK